MAERALPEVTLLTEDYWTGGAAGELRMCGCRECGALIHPPAPACRWCGSLDTGTTVVSGRGTVVGVTVDAHPWDPAFPPPYVVASVALDEDPRARITTNIVDVDPDAAVVGLPVEVRFEHVDDVWLPRVRADGRARRRRAAARGPARRRPPPPRAAHGEHPQVRGRRRHLRHRHVRRRPPPDASGALAHRRGHHPGASTTPGSPGPTSTASRPTPAWAPCRAWGRAGSPRWPTRWASNPPGTTAARTRSVRRVR